ncbi:hypothetical protein Sru01_60910 [Sphaerisporangium rufum]|uniref:ATP-binding protein n=1 Tax=Sphaerisporangium rufum TaxID=1381558 RepID=A0A919R7X8_9ACTN|nr:hypothetical protein Sru01_60910 [Sphaerisporangium rufum]
MRRRPGAAGGPVEVLLGVHDRGGGGVPRFGAELNRDGEGGRGLAMVAALATRAGHHGSPAGGHRVWA